MAKRGRPPKEGKEPSDLEKESKEDKDKKEEPVKLFNLDEEVQKENKYLRAGFKAYIAEKGYEVNTQEKYDKYMKEFKEA